MANGDTSVEAGSTSATPSGPKPTSLAKVLGHQAPRRPQLPPTILEAVLLGPQVSPPPHLVWVEQLPPPAESAAANPITFHMIWNQHANQCQVRH